VDGRVVKPTGKEETICKLRSSQRPPYAKVTVSMNGMNNVWTHGTANWAVNIDVEPADGGFEVPDETREAGYACIYL
jgi:hypothetical protein